MTDMQTIITACPNDQYCTRSFKYSAISRDVASLNDDEFDNQLLLSVIRGS